MTSGSLQPSLQVQVNTTATGAAEVRDKAERRSHPTQPCQARASASAALPPCPGLGSEEGIPTPNNWDCPPGCQCSGEVPSGRCPQRGRGPGGAILNHRVCARVHAADSHGCGNSGERMRGPGVGPLWLEGPEFKALLPSHALKALGPVSLCLRELPLPPPPPPPPPCSHEQSLAQRRPLGDGRQVTGAHDYPLAAGSH